MLDKAQRKTAYQSLMRQVKTARAWITLTVTLGFISGLLLIFQASLLSSIIDAAYIKQFSRTELLLPLFVVLGIMLLRAGLHWLREMTSFQTSTRIRGALRQRLVQHLIALEPVNAAGLHSGALASAAIEQVEALHGFFADYLPQLSLVIFIPLAILAFIFPINWLAGLILLLSAPLIPLFMALIGMGVESLNQKHFQTLARLSGHFLDTIQGLTTLKLFNQSKRQSEAIGRAADEYRRRTMRVLKVAFLSSATLELFSSLGIALLAVILGLSLLGQIHFGAYGEALTLHKALFILLLAPEFFLPLRQLAVHYHARAEAVAASHEIGKILEIPCHPHTGTRILEAAENFHIHFLDVSFSYTDENPVIEQVNLSIAPGEHISIIGPTGAGKSTLLHLLAGFIQPREGEILINQVPLETLDIHFWRGQIAILSQQPHLLPCSIRDNIRLAKPDCSDTELEQAAEKAHVNEFARLLPQGLDTQLSEQNLGVSGGQAQRIALARIFLADKPVLLLDEPTANLDEETERIILTALQKFSRGKTVITVSHRAQTIVQAQRILRLKDHRLITVSQTLHAGETDA